MTRRVLILTHTGRDKARAVAEHCAKALTAAGLVVRVPADDAADLSLPEGVEIGSTDLAAGCEIALVIGGDGTILRAAELVHGSETLLLGINLGHVGFLAEAEHGDLARVIDAIVERTYTAEERLTLEVRVSQGGRETFRTFALNEASIEKGMSGRMVEVVIEIDGRPLSRFGCDGVVFSTPTGSTAYNFSAGGPIVWPQVEALLMVPVSAHALFARPMVVSPTSNLAVEVLDRVGSDDVGAVLWCDGRRTHALPPGARIEITRGQESVRLARLEDAPFTDRLVAKFELPVDGWRGAGQRDD